jgi:hypothetical protein
MTFIDFVENEMLSGPINCVRNRNMLTLKVSGEACSTTAANDFVTRFEAQLKYKQNLYNFCMVYEGLICNNCKVLISLIDFSIKN